MVLALLLCENHLVLGIKLKFYVKPKQKSMKKVLLFGLSLLMVTTMSFAQDRTVSGKVTSAEDGSTLPGVNVVLKGTTNGAVTDIDGNYKLTVPEDGGTLTFSFIGLVSQEVEIGSRSVIDMNMESDIQQLSEVVVSALGVERETKALGYSVQSVDSEAITAAKETNLVNSLTGRIAGVQVTGSSGAVGASSRIVLRGPNSITGDNQPLFIVDGVPIDNGARGNSSSGGGTDYGNGAGEMNPDDIESITVLKGPNAAALYGSRASNGVILITTKSGKGTTGIGVSVSHQTTFQNPLRLPDFQNSYGQGASSDTFEWIDGSAADGGVDESWGPPLDVGLEFVQWTSDGQYPEPWVSQPDNLKDYLETGVQNSTNVSLTGGDDKGNFRLSLGNLDETGMMYNTDLKRKNLGLSAGYNLSDKLRAEFTANYMLQSSDNRPVSGYTGQNPIQQFIWSGRNVDYAALKDYENLPISRAGNGAGISPINWNTRFQNNPYWSADNLINNQKKDRLFGAARFTYKITDFLSIMGRTGMDYWTEDRERIVPQGAESELNGSYDRQSFTRREINSDFLLMFNKTYGDIAVNVNLGGNIRDENYYWLTGSAPELELPEVYNLSNVKSGVLVTTRNNQERKKVNSIYGSAQIGFRNYLFLDVTGRNDWSSTLPDGDNSYFYPSVNVSAVVTDIFDIQSNILSFLKVRGGWAKVGSDTDPFNLSQTFRFNDKFGAILAPTVNRYNPGVVDGAALKNPELTPEFTTSIEAGLDARFWGGRLNLDFTYYSTSTTDQIIPISISAASGYQSRFTNLGEMTNKGIELQLSGTIIDSDIKWDMYLNFAQNTNEVVSLAEGLDQLTLGGQWNVDIQAVPGQPYGTIFGPAFVRDPNGNIINTNGIPDVDPEFKDIGNVTPDFTGGIGTSISWKGIKLDALVDGKFGGDIYSMTYSWGRYAGVLEETLLGREGGIVGPGVMVDPAGDGTTYIPNNVVVPSKIYNQSTYSNSIAESSIFDATYVKLRHVTIGYTFNNSLFGNFPIKDLKVSVVGRNLALLYSKVPHIDPETGFSSGNDDLGQEFGQLPSARSVGFNVSFKF